MLTVGVDLAAEPAGTAVATIEWSPGSATVREVVVGAGDEMLLDRIGGAHKAASTVHSGGRRLAYRVTDDVVREATGRLPLSVAADRIGHTAMRVAALLSALAATGHPVDRARTGVVVEVYPAASLRIWGLPGNRYKGTANPARLADLVDGLTGRAGWLDLGPYEALCRRSELGPPGGRTAGRGGT
jgi:hypothetical protein